MRHPSAEEWAAAQALIGDIHEAAGVPMTAPLPPYQPRSPAWQAGYEHAKRQAAALIGVSHDQIASLNGATTVAAVRAAISAMRPSPPRVSPGMEPTPYSAPTRIERRHIGSALDTDHLAATGEIREPLPPLRHERWGPTACQRCGYTQPECTCIGEYVPPTTLHARVAAQDSGSGADALCGQIRGNEGVGG